MRTLTDDVIRNWLLYGFEVLKPINFDLGVRLRPLFAGSYDSNFYNTVFGGYYTVDSTEGCIQQSKLIRSEGDLLVGINRVDLKGWPHERVQKQLQDDIKDNTTPTIHLTFMDNEQTNDQLLQHITTKVTTPMREQTEETTAPYQPSNADSTADEGLSGENIQSNNEEAGQQTEQPSNDENAKERTGPYQSSNAESTAGEGLSGENMQSNKEKAGQQTEQPSNDVNAVILHPATADIPEHTESAKFATEKHFDYVDQLYKPFEFYQFMYSSRQHIWWGYLKNVTLNAVLCYRWMCDNFEPQFIRQCLMESNKKQKAPKLPQLYRNVNGKEKKIIRVQFRKDSKNFFGYFGADHNEEVSEDWVIENFGEEFRNEVKMGKPYKQWRIRAGDAKTKKMDLNITGAKPKVFLQNGKDTCVFSSLASGFHYFNDKMASDTLLRNLDVSLLSPDPIQTASLFLTGNTLKYDAKKMKNILDDISCFPTIVQLRTSDNSIGHAVTVVGLWVFEANKAEAEPLSFDFLDWCCSTDTVNDTFVGVYYAIRFVHNKPRPEWNLCENCRQRKKCIYKFR